MSIVIRILLIDDDLVDRKIVIRALKKEKYKYEITEVVTAAEGLKFAASHKYDAILLDYHLPDQNGLKLLIQLRKKVGHGTAIVMLSQHEDEAIVQRCLDAGAQDFLLKDEVSGNRLSRAIRNAQYRRRIDDELQLSHENLLLMAEHDALTGICNRRGFERALSVAAARISRAKSNLAVILLDLDNFKRVNDTAGHEVGDILLVEVSKRLSECLRENDVLCRLGGDEFVIIVNDYENDNQIYSLAKRIITHMQVEFSLGEMIYSATVSMGIAFYSPPAITISNLLHCADLALYHSKAAGRNQYYTYTSTLQKITEHRDTIKNDLINAVKNNELDLFYQAQIRTSDGTLGGIEVLVRWQHPIHGLLLPNEFLPIAEESQLISEIESWVFFTACEKFNFWLSKYPYICSHTSLAINLSTRHADSKRLNAVLNDLHKIHASLANHLEIELSESIIMNHKTPATTMLASLISKGFEISLDNFGAGYISINELKKLPISLVKIDQAYIASIETSKRERQILIALINLAKALNMRVIAQGIETKYQADFCTKYGCDLLQGFYYSYPCPAGKFEEQFMKNRC